MNKIQKFALTLSIALAAALTFSCSSDSSDDDDNVGGGLSDLYTKPNQQVYDEDGKVFNGSSDVVLVFTKWDDNYENILWRDELPAGKIENGKITLNLPSSIDSKYLEPVGDVCKGEWVKTPCINELKNTLLAEGRIYATDFSCSLYLDNNLDNEKLPYEVAFIFYVQGSGILKYNEIEVYSGSGWEETYDYTYDYNFSKGWNTIYRISDHDENYAKETLSTDPSIITGALKWTCYQF